MKNTLLPVALAALAFSASAAFADVDSRNLGGTANPHRRDATAEEVKNNAEQTIRSRAAVEHKNAGGSKVSRTDSTATTTTTSQSMSDRAPYDTASENGIDANVESGPSGIAIFSIILLVALVTGFGIRTYRTRQHSL